MEVMGTPNEEDLSFITDQTAITYLKEFPINSKGIDLKDRLPYASSEALDLVKKMVQFNPYFRPSIQECLNHPFFAKVRRPHHETIAPHQIELVIDKLDNDMTLKEL